MLYLFKVLSPNHGVGGTYCWRIVAPEASAVAGRVAITAKLAGKLPCYFGLTSLGSSYRVVQGRYDLQIDSAPPALRDLKPEGEVNRAITLTK